MLSVVIPTRESEEGLARTLSSLVGAAAEGVVREVVVVDHGSTDGTHIVADAAGCTLIEAEGGWVARVSAGVRAARRVPWLLVLPPRIFLEGDWFREAAAFAERVERCGRAEASCAAFRLVYDEFGWRARLAERVVGLSCGLFGTPLRDQGLLLSRRAFDAAGARLGPDAGHADLVAAIGRNGVRLLRADAVVLPPPGGGTAVPSIGRLLRIGLSGLGLPAVDASTDD